MFLESIGRFCFSHLRPSFFATLLALPLLGCVGYLILENASLNDWEYDLANTYKKGKLAFERKYNQQRFLSRYTQANPYFLTKHIESLSFLQKEQQELKALYEHPAIFDKQEIQERLAFMQSDQNCLQFIEGAMRNTSHIKETEEMQRHPIEVGEEDLQQLLSLIEDRPIGSFIPKEHAPQVMITDFRCEKKTTPFSSSTLEIDMKLLTREFTQ